MDPVAGLGTALQKLNDLLMYNINLVSGLPEQINFVYKELLMLRAVLTDYSKSKKTSGHTTQVWMDQIRDIVHKMEDKVETYVHHVMKQKARRGKAIKAVKWVGDVLDLRSFAMDIESIKTEVINLKNQSSVRSEAAVALGGVNNGTSLVSRAGAQIIKQENVVGFQYELEKILDELTRESRELEVISIVGMPGNGKTTLAKKLYTYPSIVSKFRTRAWVDVTGEYNLKDIFLEILYSIGQYTQNMHSLSEQTLANNLYSYLEGVRYLIVIDNVCTKKAWDELMMVFPDNNRGSRLLLTSRNNNIAIYANPNGRPHYIPLLSEEESWELLGLKLSRKANHPSGLEEFGKEIAKNCFGLRLAIVEIAELLLGKNRDWWKAAKSDVISFIFRDLEPNKCMDILELSYKNLPHHLKECYLYFVVFPKDFEIPVWQLLRLWIAEGFIQPRGREWLEDIAEKYLEDLVDRNLISVVRRRSDGRIKTCRIHEILRCHLCLNEAAKEKYFQVQIDAPSSSYPMLENHRRLFIQSHFSDYISSKPFGPLVRSFLCFSLKEWEMPQEHTPVIFEAFQLLRVLDIRSMNLSHFPTAITNLLLLRYISLLGKFTDLPESISKLLFLQTLVIETCSRNLDIHESIWKLLQLRHLHTNQPSHLLGPPAKAQKREKKPLVLTNLQTLSLVSPCSCTENVLVRTPNLKKLAICGKLVELLDETGGPCLFDNLTKLDHLETLKLLNEKFQKAPPPPGSKLPYLPPLYKFPPHLKKLTLSHTFLEWKHMSILGMLPELEVLKLKYYAFTGQEWKPVDKYAKSFHCLRVLQVGETNLVHWEASTHHFPILECLILKHCESLQTIPSALGDIPTLSSVKLYCTSSSVAASARLIQQDRKQKQQQQNMVCNTIKLFIHPPGL